MQFQTLAMGFKYKIFYSCKIGFLLSVQSQFNFIVYIILNIAAAWAPVSY